METSLKTGFAQIFSRCPKNLSCPKFGGAAAPHAPPGPYAYDYIIFRVSIPLDVGWVTGVVVVWAKVVSKSSAIHSVYYLNKRTVGKL